MSAPFGERKGSEIGFVLRRNLRKEEEEEEEEERES